MLAAAWTLQAGGHVRVDIFYARRLAAHQGAGRSRRRAAACCCRSCWRSVWFALPYVARSWAILERSRETSGLPFVFLLKTLIPLFALLLALQGVAQAIRAGAGAARAGASADMSRCPKSSPSPWWSPSAALLFAGYPVALTLGGVSLAFAFARPRARRDELLACSARCRSASSAS